MCQFLIWSLVRKVKTAGQNKIFGLELFKQFGLVGGRRQNLTEDWILLSSVLLSICFWRTLVTSMVRSVFAF